MKTLLRASSVLALLLLGPAASAVPGSIAQPAERGARAASDKIHPQLERLLAERGPSKAWVFFADKGLEGASDLRAALAQAESDLHPRTRARRQMRRTRPGLVDLQDVPVSAEYVNRVVAQGVELVVQSSWLNAISVVGDRAALERVASLPFVTQLDPVRRGVIQGQRTRPTAEGELAGEREEAGAGASGATGPRGFYGDCDAQLDQIGVLSMHARGYRGAGIVVGILDTGFHRGHEAFNQPGHVVNVLAEWDFVDNDPNTDIESGDDPSQHAHGTYILGTLAAWLPGQLMGGANEASFVLAKTEDITNEYQGEEDFYVAGLQFIEANGADLATSSLGYIDWYTQSDLDGLTAKTTLGVNAATANGLVCCTAAVNYGNDSKPTTSTLIAPADAFDVITVGAVDFRGTTVSFSSDGPTADGRTKPEVMARGLDTWTVCAFSDSGCTSEVSGTSLSTPLVAGAVACMLQASPAWSVDDLRQAFLATGQYFRQNGAPDPLFVRGYGIPNADAAVFGGPRFRPGLEAPEFRSR